MMGAGVIRIGLSWGRTLEPRELGLRGFRTMPRRRPGTPAAPAPSTRRADRVNKPRGHGRDPRTSVCVAHVCVAHKLGNI